MSKYQPCPCSSKHLYHKCCKPYHDGLPAENALKLMRSRFAAYALDLPEYIIRTTHRENSAFTENHEEWKQEIRKFSNNTNFDRLEILEFIDGADGASVTFRAHLRQKDQDASFTEKSAFKKESGNWQYHSGEFEK
jgi:SEC-C motif domain protein